MPGLRGGRAPRRWGYSATWSESIASDDGAPGHLVVQAPGQAAGREGDAAAQRGIGRALRAPRSYRTAHRAAGALSCDGVTQDGVVQRVHLGAPVDAT